MIPKNAYKTGSALLTFFLIFSAGCGGEKKFEELSSPQKTVRTYMENASILSASIDPAAYLHAISCFSKEDQAWFDAHFESLPFDKDDDSYKMLNLIKKKTFAFGEVIFKAGPQPTSGALTEKDVTDTTALVEVEGYPSPISLVKEGPNWKIKGLFGAPSR